MFDPEGKTIAPPHVSNGPPLTVQLRSFLNMLKIPSRSRYVHKCPVLSPIVANLEINPSHAQGHILESTATS